MFFTGYSLTLQLRANSAEEAAPAMDRLTRAGVGVQLTSQKDQHGNVLYALLLQAEGRRPTEAAFQAMMDLVETDVPRSSSQAPPGEAPTSPS